MRRGSDAAMEDFKTAVQIDANDSDVYYHRAQVNFLNGKLQDAISDYKKSMELNRNVPFGTAVPDRRETGLRCD